MAHVTIQIDLPEGVTITSYQRLGEAHAFEVDWAWPEHWCCQRCHHEEKAGWELSGKARVVRDLDVWGQVSYWTYPAAFHRCERCHHRQDLIPPFKRKEVSYTYRFEQQVVRLMIGSTEEEVGRRLGISAETVARIVKVQVSVCKQVDPQRVITDVGMDEISLKKRHKLYVTILTDLSRPEQPEVLAVMSGRDEAAATKCLECLTAEQRAVVRSYRVDMGAAYNAVCAKLLPKAAGVIDRFHVAKLWNDAIDGERKKITRQYKATLSREQRQKFRSQMWLFRRNPLDLTEEDRSKLEDLFKHIPQLRTLHELRVRFKTIFDTMTKRQASLALTRLCLDAMDAFLGLEKVVCTYEKWQLLILNYFPEGKTSAAVEGINNKARVITKRSYGIKSADSLWTRLILDVNRAGQTVLHTINRLRELVAGFRAYFSMTCS
jgi:transposase